jgi:hypothetical protein
MTTLIAAISAPSACGGSTDDPAAAGVTPARCTSIPDVGEWSGGFEACAEGYVHRPSAGQCPLTTQRVACDPATMDTTLCSDDATCLAYQPNGYCAGQGGRCICQYPCTTDADCGDGLICQCRAVGGQLLGTCSPGRCASDDDCGGTLCASWTGSCSQGFDCFAATDRCRADSECGDGYMCAFKPALGARECVPAGCGAIGRPFLVAGTARLAEAVPRADWIDTAVTPKNLEIDPTLRGALAKEWTRVGLMEHASIAAFARFVLELLALGAPPDLIEHARAAMADETRHAQQCFALASAYAGRPIGPGRIEVADARIAADLESCVHTAFIEGCVGETVAAAEAAAAACAATDPNVAAVLQGIAEDEARHAALAWRFVAWALGSASPSARKRIASLVARWAEGTSLPAPFATEEPPIDLTAHGFVTGARRAALQARVVSQVIVPCARQLSSQLRAETSAESEGRLPVDA